jgi:nicotinamidase-related amidase
MSQKMLAKGALVLIEFQREWLDEGVGKINDLWEDGEQLRSAVEGAERALSAAREAGMRVVHCGLRFQEGHPELGGGAPEVHGLKGVIPKAGTFLADGPGSEFVEPFVPREGEFVVRGRTGGSGFAGSNLDVYLRNQGVEEIYLAGFALHVCVESTLRAGHDRGYRTAVLEDATAAFTPGQRRHVLEDVVHHFGESLTVDEFVSRLAGHDSGAVAVDTGKEGGS